MKLTNAKIKLLTIGKKHADGAGLYLLLSKRQQGKWSYRFMLHNKSHEMGLGQYPPPSHRLLGRLLCDPQSREYNQPIPDRAEARRSLVPGPTRLECDARNVQWTQPCLSVVSTRFLLESDARRPHSITIHTHERQRRSYPLQIKRTEIEILISLGPVCTLPNPQ